MALYFRAVALDFDGTLTEHGQRPAPGVLAAMKRTRDAGYAVILVTGRIIDELRQVFADFADHFDAVVAENGAVLQVGGMKRLLADPVSNELARALRDHGAGIRCGDVLMACGAQAGPTAVEQIRRLGLDSQLVYNRSELMIMPAGVTKGTGLIEALNELDISPRNVIAVGDAENDLALLHEAELAVAVANSVESVRARADLVTDRPNGSGVRELLDGPVVQSGRKILSERRRVQLGIDDQGDWVEIPAAQINLLICGDSGSGKSRLAGLFAERLISLGYCILVIDPEGDHLGLARLRDTIRYSAADRAGGGLPPPARVVGTLRERLTSVVLDLSGLREPARSEYLTELGLEVSLQRMSYGLPHWVVTDEAQDAPDCVMPTARIPTQSNWGYALVSWQPNRLDAQTLRELDAVCAVAGSRPPSPEIIDVVATVCRLAPETVSETLRSMKAGQAFLGALPSVARPAVFTIADRITQHVRHWHKYVTQPLTPERWFYFRDEQDVLRGTAANLTELHRILATCDSGVIRHHAANGDLSSWMRAVFQDDQLAEVLVGFERDIGAGATEVEVGRMEILSSLRRRYGV
ncbi:MAG: HAD hydrolase family protein [Candidatus Nanopelagicales bacterium]|nr:HAD hydrolase family protein [Candidatus Nanopelagicales bacterium]